MNSKHKAAVIKPAQLNWDKGLEPNCTVSLDKSRLSEFSVLQITLNSIIGFGAVFVTI